MAVYSVKNKKTNVTRIVEARTTGAARNHVVDDEFEVKTLNTSELVKHINDGLKIETVTEAEEKAADDAKAPAPATPPASADKSTAAADKPAAEAKKGGIFGSKSAA